MRPFIRGMLIPLDGGAGPVIFQWNPAEVTGPDANPQYATIGVAGRQFPLVQYSNGKDSVIRFDLQASRTMSAADVMDLYDSLIALTKPQSLGQGVARPPKVRFMLGDFLNENVVVQQVQPKFSRMFDPVSILPTEAKISVTLLRLGDEEGGGG